VTEPHHPIPPFDAPGESPAFLLASTTRVIRRRFTEVASSVDLTDRQFSMMLALTAEDGASAARLVERMASDSSTVGALLDRLVSRGLVRKEPDPDDRRVNRHFLTEEGHRKLEEASVVMGAMNERMKAALDPGEFEAFRATLEKLRHAVE
jgi:MarR family transcriptional regulator, transcriptional regulator for hemolysin